MTELIHINNWQDWAQIEPDWETRWPNFSPEELRCRGTDQLLLVPESLDRLQAIRTGLGFPFAITSAGRSPEHNAIVSEKTGRDGPHTTGRAWDIAVLGENAYRLVCAAYGHGFTGIGVKQNGPHDKRFIHLDDIGSGGRHPRPWCWSY